MLANPLNLLASPRGFEPLLPACKAGVLDLARRWGRLKNGTIDYHTPRS